MVFIPGPVGHLASDVKMVITDALLMAYTIDKLTSAADLISVRRPESCFN
jgi:hypothetical protein